MRVTSSATTEFPEPRRPSHRRRGARRGHGLRPGGAVQLSCTRGRRRHRRPAAHRAPGACVRSRGRQTTSSTSTIPTSSSPRPARLAASAARSRRSFRIRSTWEPAANSARDRPGEGAAQRAGRLEQLHAGRLLARSAPVHDTVASALCCGARGRSVRRGAPSTTGITITSPAPGTTAHRRRVGARRRGRQPGYRHDRAGLEPAGRRRR